MRVIDIVLYAFVIATIILAVATNYKIDKTIKQVNENWNAWAEKSCIGYNAMDKPTFIDNAIWNGSNDYKT